MSSNADVVDLLLLLGEKVVERVQAQPASTLAGAAGVGFVLGHGLPDSMLRMGTAFAARTVVAHLLAEFSAWAESPDASSTTTASPRDGGEGMMNDMNGHDAARAH